MEGLYIVYQERGVITVGICQEDFKEALYLRMSSAAVIRHWGTSHGLGELARRGPLDNTQLDREGHGVVLGKRHIIKMIKCLDCPGWDKYLATYDEDYKNDK